MSNSVTQVATVLGRLMIVTIFLMSALGNKIPNLSGVVKYIAPAGAEDGFRRPCRGETE